MKLAEAGENVTATFQFTKKADGTKAEVNTLTREMKWGSMWTITVNPKVEDTTCAGVSGIGERIPAGAA